MTATSSRGRILIAGLASIAAIAGSLAASGQGPGAQVKPQAAKLDYAIFGAKDCKVCHEQSGDRKKQVEDGTYICQLDEWTKFTTRDRHKNALSVLSDPRAKRMGELLQIADVSKERSCKSCHSIVIPEGVRPRAGFDALADGVTCVSCHGETGIWGLFHADPELKFPGVMKKWSELTRIEKERDYGMTDLWDPVIRATKCASCHIGNSEEGKVVTHRMYAAGHPPLPGVEVATFSNQEPRHWQYLSEKLPNVQKRLNYFEPDRLEQTELVAVSGLVSLREALKLYVDEAGGKGVDSKGSWPDFARFDCYACHHDLQRPGWRPSRGFADAPGRPPAPAWPAALVRLGVAVASGSDEVYTERMAAYEQKSAALRSAFGAKPFGDTPATIESAKPLIAWAEEMAREISKVKIDKTVALRALRRLCKTASLGTPDYDSAREIAWAFKTIYDELVSQKTDVGGKESIDEALKSLDRELTLTLYPKGQGPEPIEKELKARMSAAANYDPVKFQKAFQTIEQQLPK